MYFSFGRTSRREKNPGIGRARGRYRFQEFEISARSAEQLYTRPMSCCVLLVSVVFLVKRTRAARKFVDCCSFFFVLSIVLVYAFGRGTLKRPKLRQCIVLFRMLRIINVVLCSFFVSLPCQTFLTCVLSEEPPEDLVWALTPWPVVDIGKR